MRRLGVTLAAAALLAGTAGCSAPGDPAGVPAGTPAAATSPPTSPPTESSATPTPPTATPPTTTPPSPSPSTTRTGPTPSDGRPVEALLSVPALGLAGLPVVPYEGWTDDAPGTALQDRGVAASPHGARGGTGPGGVGNYQVTAHRTSSTAAFRELPGLAEGELVHVDAEGVRYTYRVVATRRTSFRSEQSLAEQRAAVPGRPGESATQAMITLSTCLTPEDHAAGNYWTDRFHNPEHRADKVGVLVASGPVGG